jgi:uncharacterized membrane protein YhaH (DUF805 family)
MWNFAKDPQEEKYQQKIEAILEEKHRTILDRSHFLLNIIILSAIFFPNTLFSSGNNYTLSTQVDASIPWYYYLFLVGSIATLLVAFAIILRPVNANDIEFFDKFDKEYDQIQTCEYSTHIKGKNRDFSVRLKDGKKLAERNAQLYLNTGNLLRYTKDSVLLIMSSLLCLIFFIFSKINQGYFLLMIVIIVLLILYFLKSYKDWQ